jgi:putative ABC transport system substrate-binding protein
MKRREFISLLGGAAAAWPLAARAQQPAMPVIGFLHTTSPSGWTPYVSTFRDGLKEAGYVEGQNITIEYRWAEGQYDRLPALVADLVDRKVAVIAANSPSALAAKAATTTIPIVFQSGSDPVQLGLVASLNRPGGNVTGVSFFATALEARRLDLLHQLIPQATVIGLLVNPNFPGSAFQLRDVQDAARTLRHPIHVLNASTSNESTRRSLPSPNSASTRSSSRAIHSSSPSHTKSSHLRHATRCPRFTHSANTSRAAA